MSKELDYRNGARVIVETCMGIKPKEKVLIIFSKELNRNVKLLAEEAKALGAQVTLCQVENKDMQIEPSEEVSKQMLNSDVVMGVLPPSTIQLFLHMNARKTATDAGVRVGGVPYIKPDITKEDIFKISDLTEKMADILTNGEEAKIKTKIGTDVVLSIKDRISAPLRVRHAVPGAWGAVPEYAEAAIAPVEGTAQGTWIIDVFFEKVGAVKKPVEILIENGRAVKIEGAEEAERIRAIIKAADKNGNNIAELGIGTNHTQTSFTGTVGDKMMIGTAHLAIGKNINIGGQTFSNIHHDGVMKDVSIEIDGKKILKNGNIVT
ncbi:MAG: aminopeptidase [Candidatus Thorarchaeota archaeon]